MVSSRARTRIARPVDQVFHFMVIDFFRNYPRWSPEVVSLKPLSKGPVAVGTMAKQIRIDHGRRSESVFRVTALEYARHIEFTGTSAPFRLSYRFEDADGQTDLTFTFDLTRIEFYMRPFEKLIRVAIRQGVERVVWNIKSLVESE